MIRNFLILIVFLGVGFGANVAQSDIFVRQSPKQEVSKEAGDSEPKKRTSIFLRPFSKNSKEPALKNRYGSRLNTEGLRRQVVQDLQMLAYWQKTKRKPQGLRELQAYAVALRARNLASVMNERNKVLPGLLKAHDRRFALVEQQVAMQAPNRDAVEAANAYIMASLAGPVDEPAKAASAVYKKFNTNRTDAVKASVEKPESGVRRSIGRIMPIYRQQNKDNSNSSDSADRVYKNYR